MISITARGLDRSILHAVGCAVLAFAAFSTADAIGKRLSADYSVLQIVFTCALFALLPVTLSIWGGGLRAMLPRNPALVAARGALATGSSILAWFAFSRLPLADVYAIVFTVPMLVTALSVPLLGERVYGRRWTAVLVGFAGVLVMVRPGFAELGIGHLAAAGTALCGALAMIVLRKIGGTERGGTLLLAVILGQLLVTTPFMAGVFVTPRPQDLLLMACAGMLIGGANLVLARAVRLAPVALLSPFQYTQIVWALVFGFLLFGDLPEPMTMLGATIVIGSGLYILWRETVRRTEPSPPHAVAGSAPVPAG